MIRIVCVFTVCVYDLLAILGKDSWGEICCVAAPRVLLFTPVLLLIVHRLAETSEQINVSVSKECNYSSSSCVTNVCNTVYCTHTHMQSLI